jgi:hypothetical protein
LLGNGHLPPGKNKIKRGKTAMQFLHDLISRFGDDAVEMAKNARLGKNVPATAWPLHLKRLNSRARYNFKTSAKPRLEHFCEFSNRH